MSVRKASKREIQKEERRATASEPVLKPKPMPKKSVFDKPIGEKSEFPKKARFPNRKIKK